MEIIDAQIHVWEHAPPPGRAWEHDEMTARNMPVTVTAEDAIAAMDAVGVHAAVLSVPPSYRARLSDSVYRYDNSYAEEAAATYPGRFCSVGRVDPGHPDLEEEVARVMRGTGVAGLRVAVTRPQQVQALHAGGYERLFAAAESQGVPVMLLAQPELRAVCQTAKAHPSLQLIVDHVGLVQPNTHMPPDPRPLDALPDVLALAELPNVFLKLTGMTTLSGQPYPFADLRDPVRRIIDAFGPARLLWGSDYTRTKQITTYAEALHFFEHGGGLTEEEQRLIFAANLTSVLRWPEGAALDLR
jgi:L-fuconolactonase